MTVCYEETRPEGPTEGQPKEDPRPETDLLGVPSLVTWCNVTGGKRRRSEDEEEERKDGEGEDEEEEGGWDPSIDGIDVSQIWFEEDEEDYQEERNEEDDDEEPVLLDQNEEGRGL
ncbi:hypothetical protein DAPPUDRAFT_116472 [Daphnia pulex]|uniref:Uncharacterized protein n=1 Tax=Daphnia pulex TaxID=6669 RepID=E9HPI0_DAPPU|nr:hypothetical protein DAPPUDRAFT_116472 [Daphnia pulex]|eukprot:EFX66359.1 hypothetical protein DAPPUDRAFT_116472 [Daphnia pulex]